MENIKKGLVNCFKGFSKIVSNFFTFFIDGGWKTKLSYLIMGAGCFLSGQIHRGIVFISIQLAFIYYMFTSGFYYLGKLATLGTIQQGQVWDEVNQIYRFTLGDNSMLCLLFGVTTVCLIILFIAVYYINLSNSYKNEKLLKEGKKPLSLKEDIHRLLDTDYHITILSIPTILTFIFTILPLVFMICIAFTNYDKVHQPPGNLFTWVGFTNFSDVLWDNPLKSQTFISLLGWTFIWAICATFLNYIFGMILAMIINKKGIKFKGMWRTIFVITIAVPQFVSLLLMSKLLADSGAINQVLQLFNMPTIKFLTNGSIAKIVVIIINLWVGIPYTMLITSGILMNIPQDLYESAKIDGASAFIQFTKITLPYMIHVTTPYLITQFIGNINNFNVIYLLTGGGPKSLNYYQAGETDLLITWLYKLTTVEQNYALASVIGILIFIICATLSLVTFNKSNSMQKEDEFQ